MGLDMSLYKIKKKKGKTLEDLLKLDNCHLGEMVYWRKANQIHNWFVNNVQNGIDDGGYYEVSKKQLEELLKICKEVISSSVLIRGKIHNGNMFENGEWKPIIEDGFVIEDSSIAKELLPTCEGFFFGSTDYDEHYIDDINYTIEKLDKILKNFDFDNNYVVYSVWW